MRMKSWLIAGAAMALSSVHAYAAPVVFTTGPTNGTVEAYNIAVFAEAAPFTLTSAATITGFEFGGWTGTATPISSISYGFSPTVDFSTPSTTTLSAGPVITSTALGLYTVRDYSASISPVTLAAGTYYFNLFNAQGSGSGTYWDLNNSSPTAYYSYGGTALPTEVGSNLAFTLFGPAGAVPEPGTWAMMLLGFGVVGASLRRRPVAQRAAVRLNIA